MRPTGVFLLLLTASLGLSASTWSDEPSEPSFQTTIAPFLETHCSGCHSGDDAEGGIAFDKFVDSARVQTNYELWETVIRLINEHQMPPADEEQPSTDEVIAVSAAIEFELSTFDCSAEQHPGRVTIRRLNRAEYNNTIRDLTGLDLRLADDFPSDDVGYGFDNMADVLTIPPILMEKYLAAAQTIAERVFESDESRKRVFPFEPDSENDIIETVRANVQSFAKRAFRRPSTASEDARMFELMRDAYQQGNSPDQISQAIVTAILASPHFLYRVEKDPEEGDEDGIRSLDGYELATRLSYFLWSSMPDERLFELAESGTLSDPKVLGDEAIRMLADPKARALVDNFAGQWLQLRDISLLMPDPQLFPDFDGALRESMRRETELFFEAVIREDRSVLEFLEADFTYVDERLARHYGMPEVDGNEFQRVSLSDGRRGILTHASILMLTSNPTRTSPVKRGKWILENMLDQPPPPPPADVPELEEGAETLGTLREQLEQHRANESCAVCHRTMDALGFGLENFDATGAWRDRDGGYAIDASGELPGGRNFDGAEQLMQILVDERKEQFSKCLAAKLLTYALGRGLESYDRCVVKDAVAALETNDYKFSALIKSIVTSDPFRLREAERKP